MFSTSSDVITDDGGAGVFPADKDLSLSVFKAIRVVVAGEKAIAVEMQQFLREDSTPSDLSKRQREVLLGVANGQTSDQIADSLGISVSAVKQHITAVCEKLNAASRSEAVTIALRRNLLKL